jgi:hypothetical protein
MARSCSRVVLIVGWLTVDPSSGLPAIVVAAPSFAQDELLDLPGRCPGQFAEYDATWCCETCQASPNVIDDFSAHGNGWLDHDRDHRHQGRAARGAGRPGTCVMIEEPVPGANVRIRSIGQYAAGDTGV